MRWRRVGTVCIVVVALAAMTGVLVVGREAEEGAIPDGTNASALSPVRPARESAGRTSAHEEVLGGVASDKPAGEDPPPTDRAKSRGKPLLDISDEDDENEDGTARTPEERELVKRIEVALEAEDLQDALACAPAALKCRVPEIRQAMVDALGWFGKKALPELTPFLADPDEDISDSAQSAWGEAVADIDDDAEKIATVELAMGVLTDEDSLDDISSEYIGVDEKLAIESLLRVIEGNGSAAGVAKAKETYEFVTGDEFESRAAAEKWIAEEYEPSDAE